MKYALLLSGGIDKNANKTRYNNDLGFAYEVLSSKYSFDDIKVLYYDGSDIKYLDKKISSSIATFQMVDKYFENLSHTVKPEDTFFILVSNHGSEPDAHVDEYNIRLYGKAAHIKMSYFSDLLNNINCKKIIVLGQCHSGAILSYNITNSIIVTACSKSEKSYFTKDKQNIDINGEMYSYEYDEFLLHFVSYLNGSYPNGNQINYDNSIVNAFNYAKTHDIWAAPNGFCGCKETPMIFPKGVDMSL
ncbi:MAG: hypothetical protein J1F01_02495 [Oscillospiraceae bacterium]|nr:hypothetical protein [Oscillospiraceae bacterium]